MVTRVPGEGGHSRSSCPPEYPTRAPEPELILTQHSEPPPICLIWGPAGTATNTPFVGKNAYHQSTVTDWAGISKQKSQVQDHPCLYSHVSTTRSSLSTICPLFSEPSWLLEPEGL